MKERKGKKGGCRAKGQEPACGKKKPREGPKKTECACQELQPHQLWAFAT